MKKGLRIIVKLVVIVIIFFWICIAILFMKLYALNEVIWDEKSPKQEYSLVVTRSGFLMPSDITVYVKKQKSLLRDKLFTENILQDLRSVSEVDISTTWTEDEECLLYIEGETEYVEATISIDENGKIHYNYIREPLFQ